MRQARRILQVVRRSTFRGISEDLLRRKSQPASRERDRDPPRPRARSVGKRVPPGVDGFSAMTVLDLSNPPSLVVNVDMESSSTTATHRRTNSDPLRRPRGHSRRGSSSPSSPYTTRTRMEAPTSAGEDDMCVSPRATAPECDPPQPLSLPAPLELPSVGGTAELAPEANMTPAADKPESTYDCAICSSPMEEPAVGGGW